MLERTTLTSLLGGSFGVLLGRLGFVVRGFVPSLGVGLALGFGGVGFCLGLTLGLGGVGLSLGAGLRGGTGFSVTSRGGKTGALFTFSGPSTRDGSIPFFFIALRII